jgi:hypothetical protein
VTTLAAIEYLKSPDGSERLREAAGLDLTGQTLLRELTRLRRSLSAEQASAVMEQAALRRRGEAKFSRAASMLFTPEGLEQASGERLARHSADRYQGISRVADFCCGIGGDTIALAGEARVDAYDNDPVRLSCAEHNATVYGLSERVSFHLADVQAIELAGSSIDGRPPASDAIFFDPSRRAEGRRIFSLSEYHPPVTLVERWLPVVPAIGVKVAPGVLRHEVSWDCEQEFVAEGTDLKECLLWFGPLKTSPQRATVLPAAATLIAGGAPEPPIEAPAGWLYDPSPAVTRAGLVWELALILGARQHDPRLAYLSAPDLIETPFARAYAIESWMPFNLKRLQAQLRLAGVGRVEVHRRGAPIDPADLERRLRLEGDEYRLLFVTRLRGAMVVVTCHPSAR